MLSWAQRNRRKELIKGIAGIALLAVAVAGIIYWELQGRQDILYTDVIAFKEDVAPHQIVDQEMLTNVKVEEKHAIKDVITQADSIIGKETANFIPKGLQLSPKFFVDQEMAIGAESYVFPIPAEWVYAFPQTVRRGDTIYFCPIKRDAGIQQEISGSAIIGNAIISAKVAFVKDASNKEVVDITEDRLDASGAASKIEVIIDDDRYRKLKASYDNGNKFIVMYQ